MGHKYNIILLFVLLLFPVSISAKTTIVINDQKGFDNIQQQLFSCINSGENEIYVKIARGTYIVKEKHLTLDQIDASNINLSIVGKGAIFIPEGREYHNGDRYVGTYNVNNSWMNGSKDVETWSHIHYAEGQIEILDTTENHCRIKSKRIFPANTDYSNAYILIPHWYQSSVYKIDKIEGTDIYFTAKNLKESSFGGYNVNDDYNYGKKSIRYKLCNIETGDDYLHIIDGKVHLPKDINTVWEGTTHRFITIQNCKFASIDIAGIQFQGNAYSKSNPAIHVKNSECNEIRIHKCSFYGMRGDVISITASPNVRIDDNKFEDCYYYGIKSDNASANTVVENNSFASMGKRMNNSFCVVCRGTDYYVADNTFHNFGYGGIGVGVWYKSKMKQPCSGIIENNELSFDQKYVNNIDDYGIMDGGAVYVWTKNTGSVIRYNYIHDFSGIKSNRGIFCDDGAYNIEIYSNVITGIANSRCIDSQRVGKVESSKTPESNIGKANVNIVIRDNIVDGSIRFEAHENQDNGCVKEANYVLLAKDSKMPNNVIKDVTNAEEDIILEYNGLKKGKIGLSPSSYRIMKRTEIWRYVRQYIKKRENQVL